MRAEALRLSVFKNEYLVAGTDGAYSLRYYDHRRVGEALAYFRPDERVGLIVERARRVVEDEDIGLARDGSRDEEALLLSDLCRRVYLIHRRNAFRGDAEKLRRLLDRENVAILTPMTVAALRQRDGALSAVTLKNVRTGEESDLAVDALFVSVGQVPEMGAFAEVAPLTREGYVRAGEEGTLPAPGLFAAGDCRAKSVRQIATAVSDGANAAMSACRWLDSLAET